VTSLMRLKPASSVVVTARGGALATVRRVRHRLSFFVLLLATWGVAGCGAGVATVAADYSGASDGTATAADSGRDALDDATASDSGDAASAPADAAPTDAASCGGPGQACCFGTDCADGGCCVDLVCVANGGACPDALGTCAAGSCGSCGGLGAACCRQVMTSTCTGGQTPSCAGCTQSDTTCSTGACIACGGAGLTCCGAWACTGPFMRCDGAQGVPPSGTCSTDCGDPGQACCETVQAVGTTTFACKGGGCCLPGNSPSGMVCVAPPTCGCSAGQCTTCGVLGTPCCPGEACQDGQGQCVTDAGMLPPGPDLTDAGLVCGQRVGI